MTDYLSSFDLNSKIQTLGAGEPIMVQLQAEVPFVSASEIEVNILLLENESETALLYNPINPLSDNRFWREDWAKQFSQATWPGFKIKTSLESIIKVLLSVDKVSALKVFW